jgi:hypothetical protein
MIALEVGTIPFLRNAMRTESFANALQVGKSPFEVETIALQTGNLLFQIGTIAL